MAFVSPILKPLLSQHASSTFLCKRNVRPSRKHQSVSITGFQPVSASIGPALNSTISARVKFPDLRSDSFQHPIDVRATRALQRLFGIEAVLRNFLRVAEQTLFFQNIGTGVKVTDKQYPSIYAMLKEACHVLSLPVPELYIRQNPIPNAYTLAVQGNRPFIVIHSSLIDLLTPEEVQAVIAHELGHLKSEHGVWLTMANLLLLVSTSTLGGDLGRVVYEALNMRLLEWQRSAELTCDRAMLLVMQDKAVVISALMKLAGGTTKYAKEMDIDEYLAQADQFEKASKTRFGTIMKQSMTLATTHPLPIFRVREINRWSESNHFKSLVDSGKPLNP